MYFFNSVCLLKMWNINIHEGCSVTRIWEYLFGHVNKFLVRVTWKLTKLLTRKEGDKSPGVGWGVFDHFLGFSSFSSLFFLWPGLSLYALRTHCTLLFISISREELPPTQASQPSAMKGSEDSSTKQKEGTEATWCIRLALCEFPQFWWTVYRMAIILGSS